VNFNKSSIPDYMRPAPPPAPPPEETDWRDWALFLLALPLRFLGVVFVLVMVIPGFVSMWKLPEIARRAGVEQFDLTLRLMNLENAARPFLALGARADLQAGMVNFSPPLSPVGRTAAMFNLINVTTVRVDTSRQKGGGYLHKVTYSDGSTAEMTSTSAHLTVPAEEITAARRNVARVFDEKAAGEWRAILDWGEALFRSDWIDLQERDIVSAGVIPEPSGGTADERLWCVWKILSAGRPDSGEELFRLDESFDEAFPTPEARKAALAWAGDQYRRMQEEFESFKRNQEPSVTASGRWVTADGARIAEMRSLRRVLPPDTRRTRLWLLDQYVGLTPASRQATRERWLRLFAADSQEKAVALGQKIVDQRREAGEPLPDAPETLPLACVVQRLTGTDAYGKKCREALDAVLDAKNYNKIMVAVTTSYPNDEFIYLAASPDPLMLHNMNIKGTTVYGRLHRVFGLMLFFVFASYGLRTLLAAGIPLILAAGGTSRKLWKQHEEGRWNEPVWAWLSSATLTAVAGAMTARSSLPETLAVQIGGWDQLLLGAFAVAIFGGLLIGAFRRMVAIVLTLLSVDVEKTWLDEIFGAAFGACVLFHFGADPLSIIMAIATDAMAGGMMTLAHRRPKPDDADPKPKPNPGSFRPAPRPA
jgi:hypothetical protein